MLNQVAWTGGSRPRPLSEIGEVERQLVSDLFREQVAVWVGFWKDKPDLDLFRTFWNRARYDGHATMRET